MARVGRRARSLLKIAGVSTCSRKAGREADDSGRTGWSHLNGSGRRRTKRTETPPKVESAPISCSQPSHRHPPPTWMVETHLGFFFSFLFFSTRHLSFQPSREGLISREIVLATRLVDIVPAARPRCPPNSTALSIEII